MDKATYEFTGTTKEQRNRLAHLIGAAWERLDNDTWNAIVDEDYCDELSEYAEAEGLEIRLI